MYVVVETTSEENGLGVPEGTRTAYFGVQDCSVHDGVVTMYWPYGSALDDAETKSPGKIVAAADEAMMELDTLIDFLVETTYVNRGVVVLSPMDCTGLDRAIRTLERERSSIRCEDRDDCEALSLKDEFIVIHPGDDVPLTGSQFFTTPNRDT